VPTAKGEVYVKLGAFEQDIELPGNRTVDPSIGLNELKTDRKGTSTPNDWADENTEFITLGYSADLNDSDSFVIDSGFRQKQQHSQFDYGSGFGDYADTTLETFSLTPRLNLERTVANLPVSWTLGADVYLYDYSSDRADLEINRNQPVHKIDVEQKSIALYGQGLVSVSDSTTLTLGWRTQRVRQEARDQFDITAPSACSPPPFVFCSSEAADFNKTDQENSFELGAKHLINDNWDVFARIGRSARFGTVDELFESDSMFQPVFSELKPQVSEDIELGVNYGNDWFGATLAVFQQDIEDEIHFSPAAKENINFDETRHQGAEISLNAQITSSFSLKAGYTYLNAEFTNGANDGNDLPLIPEHTYNVSAHVNLPSDFKGAISWNYVGESFFANDLNNTLGKKTPSYQTVDLKLSKKIADFELALQVNNLFDEKYYNFAVESAYTPGRFGVYPLPERNASFTVSYEFD